MHQIWSMYLAYTTAATTVYTCTAECCGFPDEVQGTGEMLARLCAATNHKYKIELASYDATHYCPFSGGRDICIFKTWSSLGAVLMTRADTAAEQETGEGSAQPTEYPTLHFQVKLPHSIFIQMNVVAQTKMQM